MRCVCCNHILTDFEATRKRRDNGEYLDICNTCFKEISGEFDVVVRPDLLGKTAVDDSDEDEEYVFPDNEQDSIQHRD